MAHRVLRVRPVSYLSRLGPSPSRLLLGLLVLGASCVNELPPGALQGTDPDAAPPPQQDDEDLGAQAKEAFQQEVAPLLDSLCSSCHAVSGPIGFLVPDPDVYTSIKSWPSLVDVDSPRDSRLLTKGKHEGPAWQSDQAEALRAWLDLEAAAAGNDVPEELETETFSPVVGENHIPLDNIGLSGSEISFRLERLSVGFYLNEITVHAGRGGAHLVHPLFVPWVDGQPEPDPVDRFAELDMTVEEQDSAMLGGGTLVMVDIPDTIELSVHFEIAEPADGASGGTLAGGCKNVAAFTANAQQPLAQSCASCHAGANSQATNATDMRKINDLSAEGQAEVCGQILSRVNLADPPSSGIFLSPDPNSGAAHPYKFGSVQTFNGFRDALLLWIAEEQK